MTGGGSDFLGSEILAKTVIFFGSMKDAGILLGREKNRGIFWSYEKRTKGVFGVC